MDLNLSGIISSSFLSSVICLCDCGWVVFFFVGVLILVVLVVILFGGCGVCFSLFWVVVYFCCLCCG